MNEHFCHEHNCKFYRNEKEGKVWYSHKIKNGTGYCNEPKEETTDAQRTHVESTPPAPQSKSTTVKEASHTSLPPEPVMTPDKWTEKDRITRKSIERQTSLNATVELALKIDGVVTTEKIIATAKLFEAYLEGKEV